MPPEIRRYPTLQAVSAAAADFVCQLAAACVRKRALFTLALAGGNTPRPLYASFARMPYANALPWMQTHVFWGDERYVPAEHPDSNFALAAQTFIRQVPIPAQHVHRIPTELASPEAAAELYEHRLHSLFKSFGALSESGDWPVFDLILLGLGPDGHAASLFPNSPVLREQTRWAAATPAPKLAPPVRRITLTLPVINAARNVMFLVAGAEKQPIVQAILATPAQAQKYPAARVAPQGKLFWFLALERA